MLFLVETEKRVAKNQRKKREESKKKERDW